MRQTEKRNIITTIQNNLKEMQMEAQQFLEKHHTATLPPICSGRHYLFHSLAASTLEKQGTSSVVLGKDKGLGKQEQYSSLNLEKGNHNTNIFKPKTSIYNLQFAKRPKIESIRVKETLPMNSTSLRLRMSGSWKPNRYIDQHSSRASLESGESVISPKMKTIVLNSEVIDRAEKDLQLNSNQFSPKMSKLNLPKKQSELLQKYLTKFKQDKQEQNPQNAGRLESLADKSTNLLQSVLPKQRHSDHCNKRRRVGLCRTILVNQPGGEADGGHRISKRKLKLEKELLQLPKYKSLSKKQGKLDLQEGLDCTPWGYEDKPEQSPINYDFS